MALEIAIGRAVIVRPAAVVALEDRLARKWQVNIGAEAVAQAADRLHVMSCRAQRDDAVVIVESC